MGVFSHEAISALVEAYTLDELKAKRKEVADRLMDLDMITSASGGGSAYSRQQRVEAENLLSAINTAIKMKRGEDPNPGQGTSIIIFRNTDY